MFKGMDIREGNNSKAEKLEIENLEPEKVKVKEPMCAPKAFTVRLKGKIKVQLENDVKRGDPAQKVIARALELLYSQKDKNSY